MQVRVAAALLLALAPCTTLAQPSGPPGGGKRDGGGPPGGGSYANPSALIAAEIGLNQQIRDEGQWKAYRKTAAEGAELLAPDRIPVEQWLKDHKKNTPGTAESEPYGAWMSCDGSFGVVEGGWTKGDTSGHYAAVWQRQKDGGYKWLIRQAVGREGPVSAPDMLSAMVAECVRPKQGARPNSDGPPQGDRSRKRKPEPEAAAPVNPESDYSRDHTLFWRSGRDEAGTPWLLVKIRKDGEMQTVLGNGLEPQAGS